MSTARLAYLLVGLAFALAYPKHGNVAVLLIVGAVAIEYLQYLAPTRHPRLHDAGIKAMEPSRAAGRLGRQPAPRSRKVQTRPVPEPQHRCSSRRT